MSQKRIPTPTQDAGNWGTILNEHIAQTKNPINGGFNSFDQFLQRPTNLTADDAGRTYLYTQTGNWHEWSGSEWKVQNNSEINVKDYGAIGDGVVDDTAAIQFCIDLSKINYYLGRAYGGSTIFFPQGRYIVTKTLNLSSGGFGVAGSTINANTHSYGLSVKFEKRSSLTEYGTVIIGNTGINPVMEIIESDGVTLENVGIISGTINPSTIGILTARSVNDSGGIGSCFRHLYRNLFIDLYTKPDANGGLGTIGLINISAEEHIYENLEIWCNTCVVISSTYKLKFVSKSFDGFLSFNVTSSLGYQIADKVSTTFITFAGSGRLISYDYTSPAILLYSDVVYNDYNVGGIYLNNTYISKTGVARNGTNIKSVDGKYDYIIECGNISRLVHHAQGESFGRYIIIHGEFSNCELKLAMDANPSYPITHDEDPFVLIWGLGLNSGGTNSYISNLILLLATGKEYLPLIGWRDTSNILRTYIKNSTISTSQTYADYKIQKQILKHTNNTIFTFSDREIKIGENSQTTTIKKNIGNKNSTTFTDLFKLEMPSIIVGRNSFSGTCKIKGILTNSNFNSTETASTSFTSSFSFV